ncbi:hypothetical protein MSPP1_002628 [Malassezia sp. CBS 17886]|nr:hypothetical protein MSPP1_002628 [Malassezia sp. CBS 17886]
MCPPLPPRPDPFARMHGSDAECAFSVSCMKEVMDACEAREAALQMRIDALAFDPEGSLRLLDRTAPRENVSCVPDGDPAAAAIAHADPVLGIQLLQRVHELQGENEELVACLRECLLKNDRPSRTEYEAELKESHRLIIALDKALHAAQAARP